MFLILSQFKKKYIACYQRKQKSHPFLEVFILKIFYRIYHGNLLIFGKSNLYYFLGEWNYAIGRYHTSTTYNEKHETDLAKKINIGQRSISNYVNNKSLPDLETLAKICNILEIDIYTILGTKQYDNEALFIRDKNECMFLTMYRSLPDHKKAHFMQSILTLMDMLK